MAGSAIIIGMADNPPAFFRTMASTLAPLDSVPKGMRDNDTPAGVAASRDGIWLQALRPTRVLSRKIVAGLVEIVMCR